MDAKTGKEALADVSSTLRTVDSSVERAISTASHSGANSAEAQEAVQDARAAISAASEARLHAYYASTGTNPDIGTPLTKAMLASANEHAISELDAAKSRLGQTFGPR